MNKDRELIIFSVSNLYLFWSTGIFYVFELAKHYRLIIVAEETFQNDADFKKICELTNVEEVFYLPVIRNPFLRHFLYSKRLKILVSKYNPFLVLQNNHIFTYNIYLFYWAKQVNHRCISGVYLNGQLRKTDSDVVNEELRKEHIESFLRGYARTKKLLISIARFVSWFRKMVDSYLLPKIFIGSKFLLLNYLKKTRYFIPPKEYNLPSIQLVDFYLTYYPFEKEFCNNIFQFDNIEVKQISHPLETSDSACYKVLSQIKGYGLKNENIVLILPSYLGFDDTSLERKNLSNWMAAALLLKQKFPNYRLVLKFHPRTQSNPVSRKLSEKILSEIPAITILEPNENAEKWMLKSTVIVSDVSTTLWWANFFQSKIVISLNMRDFAGSDDMRYYEGILYFDSLEEFALFDSSRIIEEQKKAYTQIRKKLPTLNEVIENYHNIYEKIC